MFKSVVGIVLVLGIVLGGSAVATADVTGSFDLDITLIPEGTQFEAVKMALDIQSNLVINITMSGMTFGVDAGFGPTGPEFVILNLSTNLGALAVFDQFVFATPFYNDSQSDPILGTEIHPTMDSAGNLNGLSFVKKRIQLEINVAGVTVSNLAVFEDVDFPNPFTYVNPEYNLTDFDDITDNGTGLINQTASFGFGDIISFSGQTVSGVTLSSKTGICANLDRNVIKKRSWPETVNPACGAKTFGNESKSLILFDFEYLSVEGITVGGVTVDTAVVWKPNLPMQARTQVGFSLLELGDVVTTFGSNNVSELSLDSIQIDLTSGNLDFSLFDFNGDLKMDMITGTFGLTLNANQNPANLTILMVHVAKQGTVYVKPILSVDRGVFGYQASTVFDTGFGILTGLTWNFTEFSFSANLDNVNLDASLIFEPTGMLQGSFNMGWVF